MRRLKSAITTIEQLNNRTMNLSDFNFRKFIKQNSQSLIILSLFVFIAYINSLGNQFVSDDIQGIVQNENLSSLGKAISTNVIILRMFSIFLIKNIFGNIPSIFRLINITFHLGAVFALFLLLSLTLETQIAFISASILAVHPIHTEAVTWISGGSYVQYTFFILLSLILFILAKNNRKYYFLSIISFLFALGFSEKAIIFPIILSLFVITNSNLKKDWKKIIPFFIITAVFTAALVIKIPQRLSSIQPAAQSATEKGFLNPLVQIPIALISYLKLIFWPKGLTLYHSEMFFSQNQYLIMLGLTLIFLAIITYTFFKNKKLFFWLTFFIISLLPTLTPLGISWIVAERYVYMGAIGIYAVIGIILSSLLKKPASTRIMRGGKKFIWPIFALIIIALTTRTIIRNTDWKTADRLWLSAAKTSPSSAQNNNNLGDLYARRGKFDKAIEHFKRAIEFKPGYASAYHNLANTYLQINQLDLAEKNYQQAIKYNPSLWQSYHSLATIYFEKKDYQKAVDFINKGLKIAPNSPSLYASLGLIYKETGELKKARQALQKALSLNPENKKVRELLLTL